MTPGKTCDCYGCSRPLLTVNWFLKFKYFKKGVILYNPFNTKGQLQMNVIYIKQFQYISAVLVEKQNNEWSLSKDTGNTV